MFFGNPVGPGDKEGALGTETHSPFRSNYGNISSSKTCDLILKGSQFRGPRIKDRVDCSSRMARLREWGIRWAT